MTKQERQEKKRAFRAEFRADFQKRFPRLNGRRLENLVKTKADMALAEFGKTPVFMGMDLGKDSDTTVIVNQDGEVVQQ